MGFREISYNVCVVKFPLVRAVGCLPLRLGHAIRPLRRWAYLHDQPSIPLDAVSLQFHCPQPYARDLFLPATSAKPRFLQPLHCLDDLPMMTIWDCHEEGDNVTQERPMTGPRNAIYITPSSSRHLSTPRHSTSIPSIPSIPHRQTPDHLIKTPKSTPPPTTTHPHHGPRPRPPTARHLEPVPRPAIRNRHPPRKGHVPLGRQLRHHPANRPAHPPRPGQSHVAVGAQIRV